MSNAAQPVDRRRQGPRRIRGTCTEVLDAARHLRKNPTPAEEVLWSAIRGRSLDGLYFRRQHPLGRFILDFCCLAHRLVVEVDGAIHAERAAYDQARSLCWLGSAIESCESATMM